MKYGELTLGQMEAIVNKLGGLDGVRDLLSGAVTVVKNTAIKDKLLKLVSTSKVAGTKRFVAKESFRKENIDGVKIHDIFSIFKVHFFGEIGGGVPEAELKVWKLLESSRDSNIIAELGEDHETCLAYVWSLMKLQPNGEDGVLLTNGYSNIFYVRDVEGILWAVGVDWQGVAWHVIVRSVEHPGGWCSGPHVFSH